MAGTVMDVIRRTALTLFVILILILLKFNIAPIVVKMVNATSRHKNATVLIKMESLPGTLGRIAVFKRVKIIVEISKGRHH